MFRVTEEGHILVTRGDAMALEISAEGEDGLPVQFLTGDVIRLRVFGEKNCSEVVLQKDLTVTEDGMTSVIMELDRQCTQIGVLINAPRKLWYEIELLPQGDHQKAQTIIGYDEDGPRLFVLFPEGEYLEPRPDVESVEQSEEDGGINVVRFVDGSVLRVKNGSKGEKGDPGDNGDSVFVRFSFHADGADFTEEWSDGQAYIGIATAAEAPTDPEGYEWIRFGYRLSEEDKQQIIQQSREGTFYICAAEEVGEDGIPLVAEPKEGVLYLVSSGEESPDLFVAWAYIHGAWEAFEMKVDLTNYVKQTDLDGWSMIKTVEEGEILDIATAPCGFYHMKKGSLMHEHPDYTTYFTFPSDLNVSLGELSASQLPIRVYTIFNYPDEFTITCGYYNFKSNFATSKSYYFQDFKSERYNSIRFSRVPKMEAELAADDNSVNMPNTSWVNAAILQKAIRVVGTYVNTRFEVYEYDGETCFGTGFDEDPEPLAALLKASDIVEITLQGTDYYGTPKKCSFVGGICERIYDEVNGFFCPVQNNLIGFGYDGDIQLAGYLHDAIFCPQEEYANAPYWCPWDSMTITGYQLPKEGEEA